MESYPPGGKSAYIMEMERVATRFAELLDDMTTLEQVWNDRQYGPGAPNAIVQADTVTDQITPDDLYGFVIVCSQIKRLMTDQAAAQGNYIPRLSKLRADL